MLDKRGGKVRVDLARHWRRVIAAIAAAALIGACTGGGEAPSGRAESGDSLAGLTHANGAVLDSAPQSLSSPTRAVANGNGGSAPSVPGVGTTSGDGVETVGAPRAAMTPAPATNPAGSAAVAPTPDELSALAASLVVPVAGVTPAELHSSFYEPRGGGTRQHNALDIPAPRNTPVISATAGRVLRLFTSKAGGLMIYAADPTERFILLYAHLDHYAAGLTDGMRLERGQTIGYVGTTGNAPPNLPHLHFGIARSNNVGRWWNGTPIDPAPLLKR